MGQQQDVPEGEEGEHLWLGGQMVAAQKHGVEVQMCMALAHQIVMSVEWPSVTNCRVNGDGGLAVGILLPGQGGLVRRQANDWLINVADHGGL